MFPYAKDAPACPAHGAVHQPIAGLVAGELLFPERRIALGLGSVFGTAVPETAVHEYGQPFPPEYEIRLAKDFLIPPPAGNFVPAKKFRQRDFCVLVAASANPRHDFRTLCLAVNISHARSLPNAGALCECAEG